MKPLIITPLYNAEPNLEELINSIKSQTIQDFQHILIDDLSTDNSYEKAVNLTKNDERFVVKKNTEKCYALKNIINEARKHQEKEDLWIGVIDSDDALINDKAFELILNEYKNGNDVVWTANRWDINGYNSSGEMDQVRDPFCVPWRCSHFRSFRATTLKKVKQENFLINGQFPIRGYDQMLMLPLLYISKGRRKYIPEVCYSYRINSCSIKLEDRNWAEREQITTIKFLRARGFVA